MHSFRNILVGIDLGARGAALSAGSRLALDEAVALARTGAAPGASRITLLHSTAADEHWTHDAEGYVHRHAGLSDEGRAELQRAESRCREAGLNATLHLTEEKAWLAIVRAVQRHGHELVVVGKRTEASNTHGAHGHLPGSVSQKLLRKCPCPVWAVKPNVDPVPRTVVAATDRSACGDHALRTAAELSAAWRSQLHVVVALQLPFDAQVGGQREAFEKRTIESNRSELIATSTRAGVTAENLHLHIGLAAPTAAIEACVKRCRADLLVIGSVGRGGFAGLLMGNTAERLVNRVDCSLLVVKPEDFVCPLPLD